MVTELLLLSRTVAQQSKDSMFDDGIARIVRMIFLIMMVMLVASMYRTTKQITTMPSTATT
jgi:hypothetical protein